MKHTGRDNFVTAMAVKSLAIRHIVCTSSNEQLGVYICEDFSQLSIIIPLIIALSTNKSYRAAYHGNHLPPCRRQNSQERD